MPLQEDYDNAGLQTGLTEAEVSGVLLCLDVTEDILQEAEEKGCNMIVSHHPLVFRRLSHVTDENLVQRCVISAIRKGITIVSMHTNLDNAQGGVNYMIARKLGLTPESISLINPHNIEDTECGSGVIGEFPESITAKEYLRRVKETFHAECVMTNELLQRSVKKVAICGGAGAFVLPQAVSKGADAFLTGEMHYHEYFDHEQEIQITVIGHYESEQYTAELLSEIITAAHPDVRTVITEHCTNPIRYYI